jgi:hypothetical protein
VQPENVALGLRLSQSRPLYEGFKALREGKGWAKLSPAQQVRGSGGGGGGGGAGLGPGAALQCLGGRVPLDLSPPSSVRAPRLAQPNPPLADARCPFTPQTLNPPPSASSTLSCATSSWAAWRWRGRPRSASTPSSRSWRRWGVGGG